MCVYGRLCFNGFFLNVAHFDDVTHIFKQHPPTQSSQIYRPSPQVHDVIYGGPIMVADERLICVHGFHYTDCNCNKGD